MMEYAIIMPALGALGTGLYAAYQWYLASNVDIEFGYTYPGMKPGETYTRLGFTTLRFTEPVDPELRKMNETAATWAAMREASKLNKIAAFWTSASVALASFSSIAGIFF